MRHLLILSICLLAACSKKREAELHWMVGSWEAVAYRGELSSNVWTAIAGPRFTFQLKNNGQWQSDATMLNVKSGSWSSGDHWGGGQSLTLTAGGDTLHYRVVMVQDTAIWARMLPGTPPAEAWKLVKRQQ